MPIDLVNLVEPAVQVDTLSYRIPTYICRLATEIMRQFMNKIVNLVLFRKIIKLKEGFRYHHAEPDYLMLVYWIPETVDLLPANASHRVGIGAFVMNDKREVFLFGCFGLFI